MIVLGQSEMYKAVYVEILISRGQDKRLWKRLRYDWFFFFLNSFLKDNKSALDNAELVQETILDFLKNRAYIRNIYSLHSYQSTYSISECYW